MLPFVENEKSKVGLGVSGYRSPLLLNVLGGLVVALPSWSTSVTFNFVFVLTSPDAGPKTKRGD